MTRLVITYVQEPPRVKWDPYPARPQRCDRFLDEVSRHASFDVLRRPGYLRDVASMAEGFILLDSRVHPRMILEECAPAAAEQLASRLVPIELTQGAICKTVLEPFSLAAGIDALSLFDWELAHWGKTTKRISGIYGRQDVGRQIGADYHALESPRYSYMTSSKGLPHLLVDYLRALRAQQHG